MRTSVDVHNFLVERDVPHELVSTRGRLRSARRIASILDLPPQDIGKVVILEGSELVVAAVVPADCRADPELVAREVAVPALSIARPDRASAITGYLAESTPPVGLPNDVVLVLDESLLRDDVLYFPGGEVRAILKIRGRELARATGARVASVAAPPSERRRASS